MPGGPGHAHSENLPWLEVPPPVPAAEEESGGGGGLVPPIRGEGDNDSLKTGKIRVAWTGSFFLTFSSFFVSQQQKKYQKIKSATTVVQSYTRGWQVRSSQ